MRKEAQSGGSLAEAEAFPATRVAFPAAERRHGRASTFTRQRIRFILAFQPSIVFLLPRYPHAQKAIRGRQSTMSSNKKSSLTGYLPDILMAAAAVRTLPRSRFLRARDPHNTIARLTDCLHSL